MEIKSSLLNSKEFDVVKRSLIAASEIDGKEKFRVKTIEYINDTADNDDDEFFYDMLNSVIFLDPSEEAIAYTSPNKFIYLNCPGEVGETVRVWDFIYCHECLHQLWDTFGVKDKILKDGKNYNHNLLNIASDCVINDYLRRVRKKSPFEGGIYPESIEEKFGVKYDPKYDTQYSLYCKLLPKSKEIENDPDMKKYFDGEIVPKSVEKIEGGGGYPPPQEKHSPDYIKGWTDAIQDVLDGKVDPTDSKYKPKNTKNSEYNKGYNDCMNEIKEGLEKGITMSDSNGGGGGKGDLPEIPWKQDKQKGSSGGSGEDSDNKESNSNDSQDSSNKDQNGSGGSGEDSDNEESNTNGDQDSSDKDQSGGGKKGDKEGESKNGQDATDKNGKDSSKEYTSDTAQDAADKAKEAADKAKAKADKSGSKSDKEAADKAKEAANKAKEAADKSKEAAKRGDKEAESKYAREAVGAAEQAEDALGEKIEKSQANAQNTQNDNAPSKGQGKSGGYNPIVLSESDIKKHKADTEKIIEKYKNKISGIFGEFIRKCKVSGELKKSGLMVDTHKGVSGWNQKMNGIVNAYVKNKVFQKKRQYETTYSRLRRGSGFVKFGQPIDPGKRIKEDKLTINVAFYIDRSGSMGSSIDNVFDACYFICESLQKQFGKEKVVDKVSFKIHTFNTSVTEIEFGKRCKSGGGTFDFDELLDNVERRTKDYLINIIITDGEFNVNKAEANKFIDGLEGMIIYITNKDNHEVKSIAETSKKDKLYYILADHNFTIK
jgi:hypothetical protein